MPISKKLAFIAASLAGLLIAGALAGSLACFLGDLMDSASWNAATIYTVWFVLGVFLGFLHYQFAGDLCTTGSPKYWNAQEGADSIGLLIVVVSTAAISALGYVLYRAWWRNGVESDEGYVPASMSATLTFLITGVVTMWLARTALRPRDPAKKTKRPK